MTKVGAACGLLRVCAAGFACTDVLIDVSFVKFQAIADPYESDGRDVMLFAVLGITSHPHEMLVYVQKCRAFTETQQVFVHQRKSFPTDTPARWAVVAFSVSRLGYFGTGQAILILSTLVQVYSTIRCLKLQLKNKYAP